MTRFNKSLAAGAVSMSVLALVAGSAAPAQAGDGGAIAAGAIGGLAAGAILGGALAGGGYGYGYYGAPAYSYGYAAPAYSYGYAPAYYRTCYRHRQPVYDDFGDFAGYRVVRTCS